MSTRSVPLQFADVEELQKLPGKALEALVDQDIASFDAFFQQRVDKMPLTKFEIAALKAYVWWKTHPSEGTGTVPSSETSTHAD